MVRAVYKEMHLMEQLFERYQRMIRHPDYRNFCIKHEQYFVTIPTARDLQIAPNNPERTAKTKVSSKDGFFDCPDSEDDQDAYGEFTELRKQFGITGTIKHYRYPLCKENMLSLPIFETSMPVTIEPRYYEEGGDSVISVVHEDRYLKLQIDISPDIPTGQILQEIKSLIEYGRSEAEKKKNRSHTAKSEMKFAVWDLRYKRMSFSDIAKTLKIRRQTAYSIFKAAWRDIMGEEYQPEIYLKDFYSHCLREGDLAGLSSRDDLIKNRYVKKPREDKVSQDSDALDPLNIEAFRNFTEIERFRDDIAFLIKCCDKCPDTACSKTMIAVFQGNAKPETAAPCPQLLELYRTPSTDWDDKALQDLHHP